MTDRKKILLVSSAFYPEISPRSFRATELAKEFCRQGHSVTVISKYRDHDYSGFLAEYPINLKMWKQPSFPKIPDFTRKPFSLISIVAKRLMLMLFEYPGIEEMFRVKQMLKHEDNHDLMISFAVPYPVQWGVAKSRTKKHRIAKTWIADCGDPYMGDTLDSFRKLFYFSYLEKSFCKKADVITIPIESAMPAYYPEFHHKIKVISQGFDFDLEKAKAPKADNPIPKFAYAGVFLKGIRDPEKLMQALMKINAPFTFYVFTNQPNLLAPYQEMLKEKLVVSNYIPRVELMEILTNMDFLLNFDNNTTRNIPSKLIDYGITGRPILNIDKNFKPEEIDAFIKRDYSRRLILPDIENYHISKIALNFFKCC